jgi:hypothetical protein
LSHQALLEMAVMASLVPGAKCGLATLSSCLHTKISGQIKKNMFSQFIYQLNIIFLLFFFYLLFKLSNFLTIINYNNLNILLIID